MGTPPSTRNAWLWRSNSISCVWQQVGPNNESSAVAELGGAACSLVRSPAMTAQSSLPVELERFTGTEGQGHEGASASGSLGFLPFGLPDT